MERLYAPFRQDLVRRVSIGVEEANGQGFDAFVDQLLRPPDDVLALQWNIDLTVGCNALVHFLDVSARYKRDRSRHEEIVGLGKAEPAQLEHVAEPPRDQHTHLGARALYERIDRQGRPVREVGDLRESDMVSLPQFLQTGGDGFGRRVRRWYLQQVTFARSRIEQEQIRKRPADIYSQTIGTLQNDPPTINLRAVGG